MFNYFRYVQALLYFIVLPLAFTSFAANGEHEISVDGYSPFQVEMKAEMDFASEVKLKIDYAVVPIPLDILLDPVSEAEQKKLTAPSKGEALKIGFGRTLPRDYQGDLAPWLIWEELPEEGHVAVFSITSPEAKALRVGVKPGLLAKGVEVRFFSITNAQAYGPFDIESEWSQSGEHEASAAVAEDTLFWSPVIEGETAGIEIFVPFDVADDVIIQVPQIQHLVYSVQDPDDKRLADIGRSGSCNIDVSCRATNPNALRGAVGKIVFTSGGGTSLCTGTLLNDRASSGRLYFMTANHCLSSQTVANTINSYWFFERATCGGANPTTVTQFHNGANLLATGQSTDFTLLELRDQQIGFLPAVHFAGWTIENPTSRTAIALHHPMGDLKKWSEGTSHGFANYGQPVNGTGSHIRATWAQGTTEPGSSGSGLFVDFGQGLRFVGNLHGGSASCQSPAAPDWYGRFDQTYSMVSQWLWAEPQPRTVTATAGIGGTVTPTSRTVNQGSTASFTVSANAGYTRDTAVGGTCPAGSWSGAAYTTGAIQSNCSVSFSFSAVTQSQVLSDGVPVGPLSGSQGSERYYSISVPSGARDLVITLRGNPGNTGDADLYVRRGSAPTTSTYDCRGFSGTNNETCTFATPASGTYYVMVHGWTAYSGVMLEARYVASGQQTRTVSASAGTGGTVTPSSRTVNQGSTASFTVTANTGYTRNTAVGGTCPAGSWSGSTYTTGAIQNNCSVSFSFTASGVQPQALTNGQVVSGLTGSEGSYRYFSIDVPAGRILEVQTWGGSGDADLYVRRGALPTLAEFDCRSWSVTNDETCVLASVAAGTYYVLVHGRQAYSGVSLGTVRPRTVSATAGTGGTVTPASRTVNTGSTASFAVTANTGYTRNNAVGGTCLGGSWSGNTYTTGAIRLNCSVSFSFSVLAGLGDRIGLYDPRLGTFYLRNALSGGAASHQFRFGVANAGWVPLAGDWNGNGQSTVGLYDPRTGTFYLRNAHSGGAASHQFRFGVANAGWVPLAGDWNGNGQSTVGLYDPRTGTFYLRNAHGGGAASHQFRFGVANAGWLPLAGDWNGNGQSTVGLYDPRTGTFYLRNAHGGGAASHQFRFGVANAGWVPLAGDWNGNRQSTVGLYDPRTGTFYLRNAHGGGAASHQFRFGMANAGWRPISGKWTP